ncbi:putative type I restriction-modification system, M subunit [Porphyromonas gingivalis TDC60]|uniref:type I restriction enzyme HsdR N-terminal domain-containing protein n=1 Tax=Porphyromonas gingivalis TaxID=837 RepID=UPI00020F03EB|nr:type I restriction enzyme HsdR N-terminal domain-containing protein [Porphyromonas gingivalis]BAK26084.1 putative type I restriction-modification system, M subunit [Porphyromonas gingivalis TDC60]
MSKDINYQIVPEGKIRDYIDGTIRKDTPEEYVRQTVEKRLVIEHKYPKQRIAVEYPIKMGDGKKRADIVIFSEKATAEDLQDQQNIVLIIECKKESVKPTDKGEGVSQLKTYMASCSNCVWGMWTNGKHKTVYQKVTDDKGASTMRRLTTSLLQMVATVLTNVLSEDRCLRLPMIICSSLSALVTTLFLSMKDTQNKLPSLSFLKLSFVRLPMSEM